MTSTYNNSQNFNREAPYFLNPHYHFEFLNNGNPEPQYPYDALDDRVYQTQYAQAYPDVTISPMNYPYSVQRHRAPSVFFDPKPTKYTAQNGYQYRIANYAPYMYWYPNPVECRDVCGNNVCNRYDVSINDYRNCKRCQRNDPAMCWDSMKQTCVDCPRQIALSACNSRYGCRNPKGFPHANGEPINPMYTGCKLCNKVM